MSRPSVTISRPPLSSRLLLSPRLAFVTAATAVSVSAVLSAVPAAAHADAGAGEGRHSEATRPQAPRTGSVLAVLMPPPVRADDSGDRLTVTVRHLTGTGDRTYDLRCHPAGGSHPAPEQACETLDRRTTWGKDPFAPVAPGTICTMVYGGPATAHVTGTWAGRPVDARFDRADGCQIARWDALVPMLPDTGA
ncbi:subtilase-type protease inhibitor [Streptomyces sp. NBC_01571]|uniref:SSI family serine proteinase inhibitor n=1 Tax=Streptomyces sp. NBC_01571 TaxID=2975883 RepID=UPI00225551F1|nr:SSI family serine proteinase inhibitor [Streptomyces sp. NBC_01571]MCX4576106.1 subtilase-type protease inhibitor [Streptomyces sp. NBC_01571]